MLTVRRLAPVCHYEWGYHVYVDFIDGAGHLQHEALVFREAPLPAELAASVESLRATTEARLTAEAVRVPEPTVEVLRADVAALTATNAKLIAEKAVLVADKARLTEELIAAKPIDEKPTAEEVAR